MPTSSSPSRTARVCAAVGALALVALLSASLAACSAAGSTGTDASTPASTPGAPAGSTAGPTSGASRTPRVPGVTGLVAAVDGSTMQVQTQTKQTAVTWTSTTAFSAQAAGTLADITVGSCVTVRTDAGAADASAPPSDAPGAVPVTAVSVAVTAPRADAGTTGSAACLGDLRGQGGVLPTDATARPTRPAGDPSNGIGQGGPVGRAGAVVGVVTAVAAQGFTVDGMHLGLGAAAPAATLIEVSTAAQTTVTVTRAATSADVKVGGCASAQGSTDESGALTATRVVLTPPVQGACSAGGAGGSGGFGPGGAPRPSGARS